MAVEWLQKTSQKIKKYAPKNASELGRNLLSSFQTAPGDLKEIPKEAVSFLENTLAKALENHAGKELRILVTGKTGQGKSTLVNGLLGAQIAEEGAGAGRCTTEVDVFSQTVHGIPITIYDSPGLHDNTANEAEYIQKMKDKCQKLSLVLYCTKMINTRLTDEDKNAMVNLTKAFGENFWNYSVFVLTFANMEIVTRRDKRDMDTGPEPPFNDAQGWALLKKSRFEGRVQKWKEELHNFLINEVKVNPSIAKEIPVIPTGDHIATMDNQNPLCLPDRDNWFQVLWETCCLRVKETQLFLEINSHRMAAEDGDKSDSRSKESNTEEQKQAEMLPITSPESKIAEPEFKDASIPKSPSFKDLQKMFEEGGRNEQVRVIARNKSSTNTPTVTQRPPLITIQPVPSKESEDTINPAVNRHSFTVVSKTPPKPAAPPKPAFLKSTKANSCTSPSTSLPKNLQLPSSSLKSAIMSESECSMTENNLRSNPVEKTHCEEPLNQCQVNGSTQCNEAKESEANENTPCEDVPIACNDIEDSYPEECNEVAPSLDYIELLNLAIHIDEPYEANENTPCENVPIACNDKFEDSYPEECNEVAPPLHDNDLFNQTIQIDETFVTNAAVKAVEETFGKNSKVAGTFKALLRYMKQPSKWFINVVKKRKQKSLTRT